MTLIFNRLIVALLAFMLVGCSPRLEVRETSPGVPLPAPDVKNTRGDSEGASDYRVGAQDVLEITVFGVKDLSRSVRVNSNGQISLPLVGNVSAGGHTIPELEHDIGEMLAKTYLQNPQVSVFVKEFASQRITMEGLLKNPGIYPITGKTSLLQAVAIAGGLDPLADLQGIVVFRQVNGRKAVALFDLAKIQAGQSDDPQVYGDDIVVVEQSGSKTALRHFIEVAPALGVFVYLLKR